jgi:hypothetical protein
MKDKPLPENLNIGPSGAIIRHRADDDLIISGRDKGGKDWRVLLGEMASTYACRFYISDLDRNRIRDVILICPTGGNGLAPTNHMLTLTFDDQGRPIPFEADGYFEEDLDRIIDLVDLDNDGKAELIYMNFDDGYWITNLYEINNARWQRITGHHGKRSYPLFTRFTYRANSKPTRPKRGRNPFAPDLSNAVPKYRGHILSYQWANLAQSEDIGLTVSDTRGRKILCSPVSWYGSFGFIKDSEQGRTIISSYGNEEESRSLLDEIVAKKVEVALYGQRRNDKCSPEWTWVIERNQKGR